MELTRRQFALSMAAAATLRSSLFEPLCRLRVALEVIVRNDQQSILES
jgi:hypothetical protein